MRKPILLVGLAIASGLAAVLAQNTNPPVPIGGIGSGSNTNPPGTITPPSTNPASVNAATYSIITGLVNAAASSAVAGRLSTNWPQTPSNVMAFGRPRTLTNLFTKVNVKDWGAKGDGVTHDYLAVQAAINYVTNGNGPITVYFPKGDYLITNELSVPGTEYIKTATVTLEGVNYDSSRLFFLNTNGAGVRVWGNPSYPAYISIFDLGLHGPANQLYVGSTPPYFSSITNVPYATVGVYCGTNSAFTNIGSGMSGYELRLERCEITGFFDGVEFQNIGDVHLWDNWFHSNARSSVMMRHCDSTTVRNGHYSRLLVTNRSELVYNFFVIGTYTNSSFAEDGGAGGHIFDNLECHDGAIVARDTKITVRGGQFEGVGTGGAWGPGANSNGVFRLEGRGSYLFEGVQMATAGNGGVTNLIFNTIRSASADLRMENCTFGFYPESNYNETGGQYPRVFRVTLDTNNTTFYPPYWSGGRTGPSAVEQATNFYNCEIITNGVKTLVHVEPNHGDITRAKYVQPGVNLVNPIVTGALTNNGTYVGAMAGANIDNGSLSSNKLDAATWGYLTNGLLRYGMDANWNTLRDEFLGGTYASTVDGATNVIGFGELGWLGYWNTGGSIVQERDNILRWGVMRLRTGTTSGNVTGMSLSGRSTTTGLASMWAAWFGAPWEAVFTVLPTAPAGGTATTNDIVATVGLLNRFGGSGSGTTTWPVDPAAIGGIVAQYDSSSNSVWRFRVADGTRDNWANSTQTISSSGYTTIRMRCLTNYTVEFSVNGEAWVGITDNALTTSATLNAMTVPGFAVHTKTAAEKNMYVDFWGIGRYATR